MKRNIYLTVITVVTILLIVAGVMWNLSPLAGISLPWGNTGKNTEKGVKVSKVWEEQELGECTALSLNLDAADVTLETGNRCEIRFEGNEKLIPVVKSDNGRWTVTQEQKGLVHLHDLSESTRINITIPEGMAPERLDMNVDAGDLNLRGIQVQTMEIQADAGDIDIENVGTQELKLDVDAGDIDVVDTTFTEGTVDADMGDLKMKNVTFTGFTAEMDAGNVEIQSAVSLDGAELKLDVDLGEIQVNGQSSSQSFHQPGVSGIRLAVKADLGDIRVSW